MARSEGQKRHLKGDSLGALLASMRAICPPQDPRMCVTADPSADPRLRPPSVLGTSPQHPCPSRDFPTGHLTGSLREKSQIPPVPSDAGNTRPSFRHKAGSSQ